MYKPSVITYTVWSLDVWGHSPGDCDPTLGCSCAHSCENCAGTGECNDPDCEHGGCNDPECNGSGWVHDDDRCDCSYSVNNRCRVGTIEVFTDEDNVYNVGTSSEFRSCHASDVALTRALIDGGFLKDHVTAEDLEFDGEEDYSLTVDDAKDGRPIFQLEFESVRDVDPNASDTTQ
jgi:hypothetical protein